MVANLDLNHHAITSSTCVLFFSSVRATVTWFRVMTIVLFACAILLILFLLGFLIRVLGLAKWTQVFTNAPQKLFDRNLSYAIGVTYCKFSINSLHHTCCIHYCEPRADFA